MRRLVLLCSAVVLAACVKSENSTVSSDSGMAAAPAPAAAPAAATPAAPPISLKDVAGKYAVTGKNEAGDTTIVTYELNATGDSTGWTVTYPNGKPVPLRIVSVMADSIVADAGPYESTLHKGAQATTHTVWRYQNGKMVGRTVAHYTIKGPDSVRIVISEGTRK